MSVTTTTQPEKLGREELIRQVRTLRDAAEILKHQGAHSDVVDAVSAFAWIAQDELDALQSPNVAEAGE